MTFLLACSLRAALIVAIGLALAAVSRRASAATRHSILAAAIVCAAVLPVLMVATPEWKLEVPAGLREVSGLIPSSVRRGSFAEGEGGVVAHTDRQPRSTTPSATLRWASPQSFDVAATPPHEEGNRSRLLWPSSWRLLWTAGFTVMLLLLLIGWTRLVWIARRSAPVLHGVWTRQAQQVARDYGVRRKIQLLQSRSPAMLATWGTMRPKVVLPRDAADWQEDRIDVVLRHELAHVRRHDWLIQMLSELLRAIYWFNPLIWIACARLRRESEHACDDTVLNSGVASSEYAAHLLDLARMFRRPRHAWSPALLMARESTLERRFKALLNPNLNRRALTRFAIGLTAILFLGISLPIAGLRVSAKEMLSLELPAAVFAAPLSLVTKAVFPPQQSETASVEGMAVRLDSGEAMADVHIELIPPRDRTNSHVTTTGRDGRFAFHNIPPGEYLLAAASEGGYLPAEYGQRSPTGPGLTIRLEAGQRLTDIRVSLTQPGSISGRVLDRDGEPVGRAQVQATRTIYQDGERTESMVASVASDDRGEYRLYWLAPGSYHVSATPQDVRRGWVPVIPKSLDSPSTLYTLLTVPVVTRRVLDSGEIQEEIQVATYFPGTTDLADASSIELRPATHITGVDITVVPPARTHRIRGTVINARTGQPYGDAFVRLVSPTSPAEFGGANARSDRNGRFEISGVLPGRYVVTATGTTEAAMPFGELEFDGNLGGSVTTIVGDNDLENISITLSAGINIPVHVSIEGRVAGGGGVSFLLRSLPGQSAAGLYSLVRPRPGTPTWNLLNTPQFTLEGVKAGDYQFAFFGLGGGRLEAKVPVYIKSIRLGAVDVLNGGLHVEGPVEHPLEIVLGANVSTLEGTVFNEKQQPVANVSVAVIPDAPYRSRADLYKTGVTDATGHFQVSGIAPGDYRIFSWDDVEGWPWQDPEWLQPYEGRGQAMHFEESSTKNVRLTVIP